VLHVDHQPVVTSDLALLSAEGDGASGQSLRHFVIYVRTLARAMPGRLALGITLTALGGLTEGIGVLILIPLLELVGVDVQQGRAGHVARWVGAVFGWLGIPLDLISVLPLYLVIIAADAALRLWQTVTYCSLQLGFTAYLRQRLHRAVSHASWVRLVRLRASDLTHAMTDQVDRIGNGTYVVLRMARDAMLMSVYLTLTFYVSPVVTVLVVSAGLVLMLLLGRGTRAASRLGLAMTRVGAETYRAVMEHLGGIKMAKSYGAEERSIRLFGDLADRVASTHLRAATAQAAAKCRFDIGAALALGLIVYVAVAMLHTPVAVLLVLLIAFVRVMPLVSGFEQAAQQLLHMLPILASVLSLEARLTPEGDPGSSRRPAPCLRHVVRLDGVSFRYEGTAEPALASVSLAIAAGQTTAIVGPSGSGKSTLADLLLGLIVPEHGRVLVDETLLTPGLLPSWRDQIGYVPQDSFHFHDTVRANLLWARPEASEGELWEALEIAAAGFVARLPHGLDTLLGDRGVLLSGGERQRIALARALLRRPAILILDEATSSLDSENERRVQEAIERLHGRLTIVVITHRLTTVRATDTIHVLEAGRLVESGDWHGLLSASAGRFRAMCEAQGLPV